MGNKYSSTITLDRTLYDIGETITGHIAFNKQNISKNIGIHAKEKYSVDHIITSTEHRNGYAETHMTTKTNTTSLDIIKVNWNIDHENNTITKRSECGDIFGEITFSHNTETHNVYNFSFRIPDDYTGTYKYNTYDGVLFRIKYDDTKEQQIDIKPKIEQRNAISTRNVENIFEMMDIFHCGVPEEMTIDMKYENNELFVDIDCPERPNMIAIFVLEHVVGNSNDNLFDTSHLQNTIIDNTKKVFYKIGEAFTNLNNIDSLRRISKNKYNLQEHSIDINKYKFNIHIPNNFKSKLFSVSHEIRAYVWYNWSLKSYYATSIKIDN